MNGHPIPDWIANWNTFSTEKKNETYNEKVCHELNVFIRENDIEYFNKVVKPFISQKLEKSIVDLCLLEDKRVLEKLSIEELGFLNVFEKCLLIQFLRTSGKE